MMISPQGGNNPVKMRQLVANDSELIRSSLVGLLQAIPGMRAIVTADTMKQTQHCVELRHPMLLILDLHLPDDNAIQILSALKQIDPSMQMAMPTNDASEFNCAKCLQAGAEWFFG